jgi:hypothetical protein
MAYDSAAISGSVGPTDESASWTHAPIGIPTFITVGFHDQLTGMTADSVTYGGETCTLAATAQQNNVTAEVWYLENPPSGNQTVIINWTGTPAQSVRGGSIAYTGGGVPGATNTDTGTGTAPSTVVASAVNAIVVDAMTNAAANQSPGAGQTQRYTIVGTREGSTEAGASSVTMSWTITSSQDFAQAVLSILVSNDFLSSFGGVPDLEPLKWEYFSYYFNEYQQFKGNNSLSETFRRIKL